MKWRTLAPGKLDTLIRSGKAIYVLNTSVLPSGDKGTIVINFYDGKRRDFFKMPPTFIPVAASDVIPSSKLGESRDFKQSLVKGMLTLVDPDQAEEYLMSKEAKEEYENLMLSEHSARAKNMSVEAEVAKRSRVSHSATESQGPREEVGRGDTVSNRVRGLIESLTSQTMSAKEVLIQLKRHATALSAGDLSYVIANIGDAEVQNWATKALSESSGEGEPVKKKATSASKVVTSDKKKEKDAAFDFDDGEMSAEDRAADASARSRAAAQQALHGESKVDQEIDRLLGGKRN